VVGIDRLYYSVPIGKRLKATIGGRVGQEDMLPIWPTAYGSDRASTVLDVMTLPGAASGAFNKTLGAGGALAWTSGGFAIGASYVSANGGIGSPRDGGIATDGTLASGTVQIGVQAEQWAVAATYSHLTGSSLIPYGTVFLQDRLVVDGSAGSEAYALSAYWQPARSGWIPSISVGWGINHHRYPASIPYGAVTTSQSWLVGLEWDGVVVDGHAFGMAVGQPTFATDRSGGGSPRDGNVAWEWWTELRLSDRIAVTPALFYLSRPLGQLTPRGERFSQFGALVRTTFTF
jgi:hypothetical protein